jgi:hypothetical protein
VTADAASKVYGDADDLKYTSSGLIHGDSLGGSLGRAAGENVGSYAINQGSLANSNYSIIWRQPADHAQGPDRDGRCGQQSLWRCR